MTCLACAYRRSSAATTALPARHLLADSASAGYAWGCLVDAMAEFGGRLAGLDALA